MSTRLYLAIATTNNCSLEGPVEGKDLVLKYFRDNITSTSGERIFFSPGRVNLIGEHIDYNGGLVFPCAIDKGIYGCVKKNSTGKLNLFSANFPSTKCSIKLDELDYDEKHEWMNYPKGVLKSIFELTDQKSGFDIAYYGDIPNGAGLSSSASIELLTAVIANAFLGLNLSMLDMVKLSRDVENKYIGVNCGIMDQFAVGFGKKDKAILLNCESLEFTHVPFELNEWTLIITNSNKRRELADSKYNERRSECESALKMLNTQIDAENLCKVSESDLEKHKNFLTENEYRRALHVISENKRTIDAAEALKKGDIRLFGKLMNSSHLSLKDNYMVTGKELDSLALNAQKMNCVCGSRMTGAGFGGAVISLVENNSIDMFKTELGRVYKQECYISADFYTVKASDGAGEI